MPRMLSVHRYHARKTSHGGCHASPYSCSDDRASANPVKCEYSCQRLESSLIQLSGFLESFNTTRVCYHLQDAGSLGAGGDEANANGSSSCRRSRRESGVEPFHVYYYVLCRIVTVTACVRRDRVETGQATGTAYTCHDTPAVT